MATNMQGRADELGIPNVIPIGDDIRLGTCNATEAELMETDGVIAHYRGICQMRHNYQIEMKVKDLQNQLDEIEEEEDFERDEEGNLTIGGKGSHEAEELGEY